MPCAYKGINRLDFFQGTLNGYNRSRLADPEFEEGELFNEGENHVLNIHISRLVEGMSTVFLISQFIFNLLLIQYTFISLLCSDIDFFSMYIFCLDGKKINNYLTYRFY